MPLDSKNLTVEVQNYLRELPYEEKTKIYDKRCKGCQFARIIVNDIVVRSIQEALDIARELGCEIVRSCEYPSDIEMSFGHEEYPSLNEIVSNTCRFWNSANIEDGYEEELFE